jgi:hypothetical protein
MKTVNDSTSPKTIAAPQDEGDLVLSDSWMLTRNHRGISYAFPVMVNRQTGEAFSRKETVSVPEELGGVQPASVLSSRLIADLPPERHEEARRYLL